MLFGRHKNTQLTKLNLQINDNNIQSTSELNFLGLHINTELNWDTHVNVVGNKISLYNLHEKKLVLIFPKEMLLSIYNALILPHVNYCLFFMGFWQCCQKYFLKQNIKGNLCYILCRLQCILLSYYLKLISCYKWRIYTTVDC